jgi:2-alkyl-3-oxoalkanoate reductase
MKVFVAGASGAIGRRLVPKLIDAGHEVVGMTRSEANAEALRAVGASAVVCDVYDVDRVKRVVQQTKPDAIVNQLTDLPQSLKPRKLKEYYSANNKVRQVGTENLLVAARAAGVKRFVLQSSAYWYSPATANGHPVGENHPFYLDAPEPIGTAVKTMEHVERMVRHSGLEAVILRYGMFYGPGTWYDADGDVGQQMRKRMYPIVGKGQGVFSFVHVDDAVDATVKALTAKPGTYNVVDDEPAPMAEWMPVFAEALKAKKPMKAPRPMAILAAGKAPVQWMENLKGADNSRAKRELGWQPEYATWRRGFYEVLR